MIDISVSTLRFGFAALYVLTLVTMAFFVRRTPAGLRRAASLLLVVVAIAPLSILLQEAGVGQLSISGGTVDLVNLAQGTVSTILIYGTLLALADASRRLAALTVGIALVPTYASALAGLLGDDISGIIGLLFLAGIFLPFPAIIYLFLRPVWRSAQSVSRRRRLTHWKARNVLLFTYGMLLAYTLLVIAGLVTDPLLNALLLGYTVYLLYGGVSAYTLYSMTRLDTDEEVSLAGALT